MSLWVVVRRLCTIGQTSGNRVLRGTGSQALELQCLFVQYTSYFAGLRGNLKGMIRDESLQVNVNLKYANKLAIGRLFHGISQEKALAVDIHP